MLSVRRVVAQLGALFSDGRQGPCKVGRPVRLLVQYQSEDLVSSTVKYACPGISPLIRMKIFPLGSTWRADSESEFITVLVRGWCVTWNSASSMAASSACRIAVP